jgi:hypothetical protein
LLIRLHFIAFELLLAPNQHLLLVYVMRYKTLLFNDFDLRILKKYEEDEDLLPKMSIQNINEYLKEGCGIIASKQLPKTGLTGW